MVTSGDLDPGVFTIQTSHLCLSCNNDIDSILRSNRSIVSCWLNRCMEVHTVDTNRYIGISITAGIPDIYGPVITRDYNGPLSHEHITYWIEP